MFVVSVLEDDITTKPHELQDEIVDVVERRINERLANKIVPDLGMCLALYDILEIGATYILPGDGNGHTKVKFRMVVFQPFVGEVIEAKVKSSSEQGLTLSIGFFEDILVPAEKLPEPHKYEPEDKVWYWEYADGDSTAKLYMDPGKSVRFRVVENSFKDVRPDVGIEDGKYEKSYEIIGTMAEHGLGCIQWWNQDEPVEDEEMEVDEEGIKLEEEDDEE